MRLERPLWEVFLTQTTTGAINLQSTIDVDMAAKEESAQNSSETLGATQGRTPRQYGHLLEREETTLKFRDVPVERNYCESFQVAVNYQVTWAPDLLPMATLPLIEDEISQRANTLNSLAQ